MSKIVFCTTCKGRLEHLRQTLPKNIADNPSAKFVIVDYGSQDGLKEFLLTDLKDHIQSGRLIAYYFNAPGPFHMSHAKNMAARLGIKEGADILVTVDADNFAGAGFDQFILDNLAPGTFLCPDFVGIQKLGWDDGSNRPLRGFAGRLAVRAQDFIKAGGYDEVYDTWRGEDIDFNARMQRMGYTPKHIAIDYLKTIPHSAEVRFKEFPHARQYEAAGGWKIEGNHANTVVNFGKLGVGKVSRNYISDVDLSPIATRVFGIGMHKTATSSLHKAFQTLGFDSLHWGSGEAPLVWEEVNAAGRSKTLERFYSACDLPIPLLYQQLDKAYPGSKFVLTIRDEAKWIKSVERLWDAKYNPTRWQWNVWPISNRLHKAMYGRIDFDAETMLARYRRHNAEVIEYFKGRRGDLLIMELNRGHGWKELCLFLEIDCPSMDYPCERVTVDVLFEMGYSC